LFSMLFIGKAVINFRSFSALFNVLSVIAHRVVRYICST
jgi:hypothetical protein